MDTKFGITNQFCSQYSYQWMVFFNMASDWLAAALPANQKPCEKIPFSWQEFLQRIVLVLY